MLTRALDAPTVPLASRECYARHLGGLCADLSERGNHLGTATLEAVAQVIMAAYSLGYLDAATASDAVRAVADGDKKEER